MRQKRIAAIHDISGVGKCSLTVALPIISAAGIECCVVPTALLSTHTGGFEGYTFYDLTDNILPQINHWKKENIEFDAVYSGYLGSIKQVEIINKSLDIIKGKNTLVIVDPVMGDNGKLYASFVESFPLEMKKLCKRAEIITPNITEACLMLGQDYVEPPYDREYIENLLFKLGKICSGTVVLTGVSFDENSLGAAALDVKSGEIVYSLTKREKGMCHGTGDVFASALTAALVSGHSLNDSLALSVEYTARCIAITHKKYSDLWYGVAFEDELGYLIERLK